MCSTHFQRCFSLSPERINQRTRLQPLPEQPPPPLGILAEGLHLPSPIPYCRRRSYHKMSLPQEPHRPFFQFGNPFRMISPKDSQLSPALQAELNSFEESLAERFRKLEVPDGVLSMTWMKSAMEALCETHRQIKILIAALELPVSDWDDEWLDVYLDISIKLLDMSNAYSSELSSISQCHLLLQCALHNLESNNPQQFVRARSSLDGWRRQIRTKNPRLEKCCGLLDGLMRTLDLPKVKKSSKGKVLMRAMYGVKVHTLFICSLLVAAFSGSPKNLFELIAADTYTWAQSFNQLRDKLNGIVRKELCVQNSSLVNELRRVDAAVEQLYPLTQDGFVSAEDESLRSSLKHLRTEAEKLSRGHDILVKEVDEFFQIVLSGRDALLSSLRATSTADFTVGKKVGQLGL